MKSFGEWGKEKQNIENKSRLPVFHDSEIWWCSLGLNIGHEEDGKNEKYERPILILRKFNKELLVGIPLSTKIKTGDFYVNFKNKDFEYSVLLSQARVMSSKRLIRKINKISRGKFALVKNKYRELMTL